MATGVVQERRMRQQFVFTINVGGIGYTEQSPDVFQGITELGVA